MILCDPCFDKLTELANLLQNLFRFCLGGNLGMAVVDQVALAADLEIIGIFVSYGTKLSLTLSKAIL